MTSNRYPHLLSRGHIGTMETRNRIAVAAMGVSGAVRGMPAIPGNDQDHIYSGNDMCGMTLGEDSAALRRKTGLVTRIATKVGAATGATANLALVRKATRAWMPLADSVTIIGGGLIGPVLAESICERGRTVNVIEEAQRRARG